MDRLLEFVASHPILIGAFILLWVLFFLMESRKGSRVISSQQATDLVNREDAVIVDLRDSDEYRKGHIAGSINVPFAKLNEHLGEFERHQGKPIIFVCATGLQSPTASAQLKQKGFAPLYRIRGGIQGWRGDNLPVVKA